MSPVLCRLSYSASWPCPPRREEAVGDATRRGRGLTTGFGSGSLADVLDPLVDHLVELVEAHGHLRCGAVSVLSPTLLDRVVSVNPYATVSLASSQARRVS